MPCLLHVVPTRATQRRGTTQRLEGGIVGMLPQTSGGGYWLRAGTKAGLFQLSPCSHWASSQHGGWVPRARIHKKGSRSYQFLKAWPRDWNSFDSTMLVSSSCRVQIQGRKHRPHLLRGGVSENVRPSFNTGILCPSPPVSTEVRDKNSLDCNTTSQSQCRLRDKCPYTNSFTDGFSELLLH